MTNYKTAMLILLFEKHLMWSRSDGPGRTLYYYYDDRITWVVATVVVVWIAFLLIRRYRVSNAQRRPRRGNRQRVPKRVVRIKNELSSKYLAGGFSNNLHAIGVGLGADGNHCIHYFVNDATQELWPGAGTTRLPASYGGVPLVVVQMPRASAARGRDPLGLQTDLDVIVGGASGANKKLVGQVGTLGYFCRSEDDSVCVLSNAHVLVDLDNTDPGREDWIVQPSPGEVEESEQIGMLRLPEPQQQLKFGDPHNVNFDMEASANFIDAAIAKLDTLQFQAVIPRIGTVNGHVPQTDLDIGELVRKVGRTTSLTVGKIRHVRVDLWIGYNRTRWAYFKDQILIEPIQTNAKFTDAGDSGSLVVEEAGNKAIGLIFAVVSKDPKDTSPPAPADAQTINNFGVANPIDKVLETFRIELLTE